MEKESRWWFSRRSWIIAHSIGVIVAFLMLLLALFEAMGAAMALQNDTSSDELLVVCYYAILYCLLMLAIGLITRPWGHHMGLRFLRIAVISITIFIFSGLIFVAIQSRNPPSSNISETGFDPSDYQNEGPQRIWDLSENYTESEFALMIRGMNRKKLQNFLKVNKIDYCKDYHEELHDCPLIIFNDSISTEGIQDMILGEFHNSSNN